MQLPQADLHLLHLLEVELGSLLGHSLGNELGSHHKCMHLWAADASCSATETLMLVFSDSGLKVDLAQMPCRRCCHGGQLEGQ